MSNPYIARVEAILGPLYKHGKLETITFDNAIEAKQVIIILRQKKKEIQLVKQQITAAKQQVHARYASQKAHVGKGLGSALMTGLGAGKAVGKGNVLARNSLRQHEIRDLQPYVDAENFIARVTAGLDQLKTQLDIYLTQHPK